MIFERERESFAGIQSFVEVTAASGWMFDSKRIGCADFFLGLYIRRSDEDKSVTD